MPEPVYQVSVTPYVRSFRQPLHTSHGIWSVRQGAIISLTSPQGHISQGEIAPLEWFGSETLEAALDFCASLGDRIRPAKIFSIPDRYPCCQFAFETALAGFQTTFHGDENGLNQPEQADSSAAALDAPWQIAALLPTGSQAIDAWPVAYAKGHRTFKWKIGVAALDQEQSWFQALITQLPPECQLRLDANAGLNLAQTIAWLELLERHAIEFLEQPLSLDQFTTLKQLSEQYRTPLALDESIANLNQIQTCHHQGWRGIYVVKPAIVGSPKRLQEFVQRHNLDIVCSSVFETAVGYTAALNLSQTIQRSDRAYGFGTKNWW